MSRAIRSLALLLATALLVGGCASRGAPTERVADATALYILGERQALDLAREALRDEFPDADISPLSGDPPGYFVVVESNANVDDRYARFVSTTRTYRVEIVPARATRRDGETVRGYLYRLSGSGEGDARSAALEKRLEGLFSKQSSQPVKSVEPVIRTRAEREQAQKMEENPPTPPPSSGTPYDKLRELKQLRDEGVISEEEFTAKKREILDRL